MILITYQYHNDKIINVKVSGHAYFANYGNDIVCAGISAILFGTLNALDKQLLNLETEIIVKEAASIVNISVIKPTSKNQIILATMY